LNPQAFLDAVSISAGHKVVAPGGWSGAAAPAAPAGSAAASVVMPDTVAQMHDHTFQAQKLGFVVGAMVTCKENTEVEIWKISALTNDTFTLAVQVDGHDGREQDVSVEALVAEWRLYKGQVTSLIPEWHSDTNPCSPLSSEAWWLEGVKGAVAVALQTKYKEHASAIDDLELLCKPSSVKVLTTMAKGTLRLVAASQRIERCKALVEQGAGIGVGTFTSPGGDVNLFQVTVHYLPPLANTGIANKFPWVAPFWLVADADGDANMHLVHEIVQVCDFSVRVPILTNMVKVQAGTELKWNKKAAPGSKKRKSA
jgi:hypothetical protein